MFRQRSVKNQKAARPRRRLGDRIRRWWKILKWTTMLVGILAIAGTWYMVRLSRWAEHQFSKSFRWDIPSRIYSDVEYLFPGLDIQRRDLRSKLDRLGYRDTGGLAKSPGDYAMVDGHIELYLHDFRYPTQDFKGFPIRMTLDGTVLTALANPDTGELLPTVRLEPELIASLFDERMEDRTLVTLKEVPNACLESVVIMEDARFFKHQGVDPVGIGRALWKNIIHLRVVQGGSTLTQQLVKNYFLTQERSLQRKMREALIALAIERKHSKGEILEAYLNEIYLGQRGTSSVSGFGEAARLYFAKNINQLTVGECALLAGMIRNPSRYSPFAHPVRAAERRNFVLGRLRETGLIDDAIHRAAVTESIITPKQRKRVVHAPYFIDFVRGQLKVLYPDTELSAEGLRIFTSLDMTSQLAAETIVAEELAGLETTYAHLLPADHAGKLQGALVSIQPQTGYIRSLVGGRTYEDTQYNRVTQSARQPGSVFKPFVYLTAFDPSRTAHPIAPSSYIYDVGFRVQSGGKEWAPLNYDKKEHGPVTAREALTHSYNIATARLGMDAGLEHVVQTARDAGISSALSAVPALSLGAFEVTPLEIATAYTIFANNGIRAEPLSIIQVVTAQGNILERKSTAMERRFDPGPVYLVTNVLKDVMNYGTAASARRMGFTGLAAGKTGTTSSYRDAWFVGFTPELLALTWVGYDDNTNIQMSGGRAALPIWTRYMTQTVGNPGQDFPVPKHITLVKIDPDSGKAWTKHCPQAIFAPFVEGAEPNESCPLH